MGDTKHEIVNVELKGRARLHRFNNPAGVPYSAIYVGADEIWSCQRSDEQDMIDTWNRE